MAKVEQVGTKYYWVDTRLTCYCDRMYCTGCETIESRSEIKEQITDCPHCKAKQSVIPTYFEVPEPRLKRQMEGQTTREGYTMKCNQCGKTS